MTVTDQQTRTIRLLRAGSRSSNEDVVLDGVASRQRVRDRDHTLAPNDLTISAAVSNPLPLEILSVTTDGEVAHLHSTYSLVYVKT